MNYPCRIYQGFNDENSSKTVAIGAAVNSEWRFRSHDEMIVISSKHVLALPQGRNRVTIDRDQRSIDNFIARALVSLSYCNKFGSRYRCTFSKLESVSKNSCSGLLLKYRIFQNVARLKASALGFSLVILMVNWSLPTAKKRSASQN